VIGVDGSGLVSLIEDGFGNMEPKWSPDGGTIIFTRDGNPPDGGTCGYPEIYAMSIDGSGLVNLTNHEWVEGDPDWSPDGTRIAFTTYREGASWCGWGSFPSHIWVMNADGSEQRRVWP
jgi:Tol biopolymer transport system component